MLINNFKLLEVTGKSPLDWSVTASVDVTKGIFKKTTETVEVYREYGCSWYFSKTGKLTPMNSIERLVYILEAKEKKKIWDLKIIGVG